MAELSKMSWGAQVPSVSVTKITVEAQSGRMLTDTRRYNRSTPVQSWEHVKYCILVISYW